MVYIPNKHVSPKKTVGNALTSIYGIGTKRALDICAVIGVSPRERSLKLTSLLPMEASRRIASDHTVGSSLKKKVYPDVQSLMKMRSYRGIRHQNHSPARGQRTHTNAQTRKRWSI